MEFAFCRDRGCTDVPHFSRGSVIQLDSSNATPKEVLAALKGKSYWHFASHGAFDWSDARKAGLLMKDEARLTAGDLVDAEGGFGRPRLVVTSACESGLFDTSRSPDEFVGLPATFMQLGAGGVLSALWQVDDVATALLIAKFYDLHLDQKLAPAAALRQAQIWLRAATKADLIAFGNIQAARAKLDPSKVAKLEASVKSRYWPVETRSAPFWNMLQSIATKFQEQFQSHPFAIPTTGADLSIRGSSAY